MPSQAKTDETVTADGENKAEKDLLSRLDCSEAEL